MNDSEKLDRILESLGGLHDRIGRVENRLDRVESRLDRVETDLRAIREHFSIDAEQTNLATVAAGARRRS